MEHLALEIFSSDGTASQWAWLPDDAAVTITDTSELFAKGDVWSHSFTLNVNANAHIFGTSGELHGSRLHDQIDRRRARLWVEGMPLFLGYLRLGDEAEVDGDGDVDVTFESGKRTFDDLVEGAKANQVPLMSDVEIGMALWRKRWVKHGLHMRAALVFEDGRMTESAEVTTSSGAWQLYFEGDGDTDSVQEYPRMVFPVGVFVDPLTEVEKSVNCLNVDHPYDEGTNGNPLYPYCNVALCYQKQGYDKKMPNGSIEPDYSSEPEAQRGYEEMPANRVNSAPNFYVIYWLRCLMKHLGIYVEENQMMDVQDLRRLFMVNTKCAYELPDNLRTGTVDKRFGRYRFSTQRHNHPRLVPEYIKEKTVSVPGSYGIPTEKTVYEIPVNAEESGFVARDVNAVPLTTWHGPSVKGVAVQIDYVYPMDYQTSGEKEYYESKNGFLHKAIATKECFPDVDISEVVKALEDGFGIRFLFSDDYQRVRIVLLRNLFRGTDVQDIACDVVSDVKVENNIRGFRMTYGDSEDTHFYYKGFADMLPHKKSIWPDDSDTHDYSQWDLKANYKNLLNRISAFDKTCYVTENNGNAWGIKVDKNAKRYEDLHPSLFEYAGFMDAEDGDCSGDEETIEEITVGFKPAIMNDVNWEEERSSGTEEQRFALFVDEKMRPRRPDLAEEKTDFNGSDAYYDVNGKLYGKDGDGRYVYTNMMSDDGIVKPGEFAITSDMFATMNGLRINGVQTLPWTGLQPSTWNATFNIDGHINEGYRLYLQDNFEPNDDGVSPIETHDWGLTLGIMRGSGSDAGVAYEPDPDDNEGNDTWYTMSGSSITAHPDTCDSYGNIWDYNGDTPGTGGMDGRFSLKLRAEKPDPRFDASWCGKTVSTKADAGRAMKDIYTKANTDLLGRPKVQNATMRAAGWDCPGDGYATVYSMTYAVTYKDGTVHDLLVSPICAEFGINVLGRDELQAYVSSIFGGKSPGQFASADWRHLLLDVDTTEERAELLHELQALYYAGDGETTQPVVIPDSMRYLPIIKSELRRRGLADQFYTEYSYWVRNARIARRTVRMELAQLLAIDKTKRVKVKDVTGFIRKMQYSVSNKTGLGEVTLEIMYI